MVEIGESRAHCTSVVFSTITSRLLLQNSASSGRIERDEVNPVINKVSLLQPMHKYFFITHKSGEACPWSPLRLVEPSHGVEPNHS